MVKLTYNSVTESGRGQIARAKKVLTPNIPGCRRFLFGRISARASTDPLQQKPP